MMMPIDDSNNLGRQSHFQATQPALQMQRRSPGGLGLDR